jgi:hypothetical protein
MSILLNELKSLLEAGANRIYSDGEESLLFPFDHDYQIFNVIVRIMDDGDYVQFSIQSLMNLRDVQNRENVLCALLDINRRVKALKFCYDPSDGEVSATVEIPVEDSTLTGRQAHFCMYLLTNVAVRERDNLLMLIRTGIYPGSSDTGFTDNLTRLLGSEETDDEEPDGPLMGFNTQTIFVDPGWPAEPEDSNF